MKKRFLSLLLALTFLAGCSGTPDSSSSPDSVSGEQSSQQTNNEEDSSVEKYNVTETAEGYVTEVNTKSVRFLGRVYQNLIKNDDYFAFGSSGIEFKFTGTKLEAEIITNSPSVIFLIANILLRSLKFAVTVSAFRSLFLTSEQIKTL